MTLTFFGDQAVLTMGTGPDHSRYDIYIGRTLWQSFDGYAATPGQRDIPIELDGEGPHQLEIRNRAERSRAASGTGYVVRFKQLLVPGMTYDYRTIQYHYDALSRLIEARYNPGSLVNVADGDLLRHYQYTYDVGGNRESQSEALNGGVPVVTNYTYNAANQITNAGFSYDPNGNLTGDGVNTYAWDQANRLLSVGAASHRYDGEGHRIQQMVGATITRYLLDLQPGLAVVLSETTGANVTRYVHGLRGIHAQQNNAGDWNWIVQDGLGSVRGVANDAVTTLESRSYAPYGEPFGLTGTNQTPYGFTGEHTDPTTDLLYLRARVYAPELGVFTALDPFEGMAGRPMSLNGYSWVEGNVVNAIDPSGRSIVQIWAAAFIAPDHVLFPYPDRADPAAIWKGDDRDWFTRYDFNNIPLSSRVWWYLQFKMDNHDTIERDENTGQTHVTYHVYGALGLERREESGQAARPEPANVSCHGDRTVIGIRDNAKNPLVALAPPIEIEYEIEIVPGNTQALRNTKTSPYGSVNLRGSLDQYPWHELYIMIDSSPVVISRRPASNIIMNPGMLIAPAYSFQEHYNIIGPVDACNYANQQNPVNVDLGCSDPFRFMQTYTK